MSQPLEATYTLSRHTQSSDRTVSPEADYTWIQPDGSQHIGNSRGDLLRFYLLLTREAGCDRGIVSRSGQAEKSGKAN